MDDQRFASEVERLRSMSGNERLAWLNDNRDQLTEEQVVLLMNDSSVATSGLSDNLREALVYVRSRTVGEEAAQASLAAGGSQIEANQAGAEAAAEEGGGGEAAFEQDFVLPFEVVQQLEFDLSEESAELLLEWIQDERPGITSLQQAYDAGMFRDAKLMAAAQAFGLAEQQPIERGIVYTRNDGTEVAIKDMFVQAAQEQFGLDDKQLVTTARLAEVYGFRDSTGGTAWQPFLALLEANGLQFRTEGESRARSNKLNTLLTRQGELRERTARLQELLAANPNNPTMRNRLEGYQAELDGINAQLAEDIADPRQGTGAIRTRYELGRLWQEGMQKYQSETLAFFHANNRDLAERMASGEDISPQDGRMALQYLANAGMPSDDIEDFSSYMLTMGFADAFGTMFAEKFNDLKNSSGGRTILRPDPVAIRQGAKDLYRSLYLEDPSEEQLNSMAASVEASIMGAPDDMNVDGNARLRQIIEGQPQYEQYYGEKPAGMPEEEYQGMHRAAQRSMLGDELADNQPVRVGMMQGQYQTTIGAAMGTKEAWDNSTFLGRLARASQIVSRNT